MVHKINRVVSLKTERKMKERHELNCVSRSTRVTVGRIGIRSGIDGASGGRRDALMSSSGAQEQNSSDDSDH
jgi:hypothetical protein